VMGLSLSGSNSPSSSVSALFSGPPLPEDLAGEMLPKLECMREHSQKRDTVVKELFSSEVKYVDSLTALVQHYKRGSSSNPSPLSVNEVKTIFSNVEIIRSFNENLLCDLAARVEAYQPHSTLVGDLYVGIAPFLKMYTQYCDNHETALNMLRQCRQRPATATFLGKAQALCSNQVLSTLLILPVQRIPRYRMLLQDLLKKTTGEHPDHALIETSLSKITAIAEQVEVSIQKAEKAKKFASIYKEVRGLQALVAPHRTYVDDLHCTVKQVRGGSKEYARIILFNDILVFSVQSREVDDDSEKLGRYFPLLILRSDSMVDVALWQLGQDAVEDHLGGDLVIKLYAPEGRLYLVYTSSMEEKTHWLQLINSTCDAWMERQIEAAKEGKEGLAQGARFVFKDGKTYEGQVWSRCVLLLPLSLGLFFPLSLSLELSLDLWTSL
jgi:RhoGEF domain